jgi:hypothetical protein
VWVRSHCWSELGLDPLWAGSFNRWLLRLVPSSHLDGVVRDFSAELGHVSVLHARLRDLGGAERSR